MALPTPSIAALWASPFRPFCALGMAYGIALMALLLAERAQLVVLPAGLLAPSVWHGHEMLFGFAAAIICATVLTALPGWAGTREIRGAPLALLVVLWAAGRVAFWSSDVSPRWLVIATDGALYVALLALLGAQLAPVRNRYFLLLLVVLAGMLAGDAAFLAGRVATGFATALYAIMLLFALKAGVFAPVFTGNHLRATGRGDQARFLLPLEYAAIGAIIFLAAVDVDGASPPWRAAAAFVAAALHAVRLARWRGWKVCDVPLLWTMHAGYAWFVLALLLNGLATLGMPGAAQAWLHAFTVGALGSMMLSLMTRVALRHTGRPLVVPRAVIAAYALIQMAAVLRVGAALGAIDAAWIVAAVLAWIGAFALYLASFGAILLSPSLPRVVASPLLFEAPPIRASERT